MRHTQARGVIHRVKQVLGGGLQPVSNLSQAGSVTPDREPALRPTSHHARRCWCAQRPLVLRVRLRNVDGSHI